MLERTFDLHDPASAPQSFLEHFARRVAVPFAFA
jgi:hypothetical protein